MQTRRRLTTDQTIELQVALEDRDLSTAALNVLSRAFRSHRISLSEDEAAMVYTELEDTDDLPEWL